MKQCSRCHAFYSPRLTDCPKCRREIRHKEPKIPSAAPEAWIRTRARVQKPVQVATDEELPTREFDPDPPAQRTTELPPHRLDEWSSEAMGLVEDTGGHVKRGRRDDAPTPEVLPSIPKVPPPPTDPEIDRALDLDEWSVDGLNPSTDAVQMQSDAVFVEDPGPQQSNPAWSGPLNPEELRHRILHRLGQHIDERSLPEFGRVATPVEGPKIPLPPPRPLREHVSPGHESVNTQSNTWSMERVPPLGLAELHAYGPAVSVPTEEPAAREPVQNAEAHDPVAVAPWAGRTVAAALFLSAGTAVAVAPVVTVAILVGAATVSTLLAIPRRANVWTVVAVGALTGTLASWFLAVGLFQTLVTTPLLMPLWQVAAIAAVALLIVWLVVAIVEASAAG